MVRLVVFCFAIASITQGALLIAPKGERLGQDTTPSIAASDPGAVLLTGDKTRKPTAERLGGSERAAVTGRQNLLRPEEYFAFRTDHDRLIHGKALLRVVPVRGPPQHS